MMTKLQIYSKYKDSGIEWIDTIPTNWEHDKIVSLFNFPNDKVCDEEFEPLSVTYGGVKKQVKDAAKTDNGSNRKLLKIGDIAFNGRSDRRGACGVSDFEGSISVVYLVLRKKRLDVYIRYFHHLFRNTLFSQEFYRWGKGIHSDMWMTRVLEMKRIQVPVPPVETQKKIADFLDEKTKIVDELVEKKEKLIELLREKRSALIARAVTKGIDPKAKMKPSGVDWLGDIPADWRMRRGKFVFKYQKERNDKYQCDHILALTLRGVINKADYKESSLVPTDYAGYQIFYKNDLVFKLIDLENYQTSRVGIVPIKGIMSPAYIRITPSVKLIQKYFFWLYYSLYLDGIFNFLGMGVRSTLNQWDLLSLLIQIPDMGDQKQISDFLDTETSKIDNIVAIIKSQIIQLKEYRSSLIYSAVTGNIKV